MYFEEKKANDLIEPYWNVKFPWKSHLPSPDRDLIEPYWNVK